MATFASLHSSAECLRCGSVLLRPACVGQTISHVELLRTFLPNLLVA